MRAPDTVRDTCPHRVQCSAEAVCERLTATAGESLKAARETRRLVAAQLVLTGAEGNRCRLRWALHSLADVEGYLAACEAER